jgi:hypothetical protein
MWGALECDVIGVGGTGETAAVTAMKPDARIFLAPQVAAGYGSTHLYPGYSSEASSYYGNCQERLVLLYPSSKCL